MLETAIEPIKRGPGRPYPPTALQSANPQDILQRYLADETCEQIATSFGVTSKALNYFLRTKAEDEWREAQLAKAFDTKDRADARLRSLEARIDEFKNIECDKAFEREKEACRQQLALARVQANRAEFELERLCQRLYGVKPQELHVNVGVSLDIALGGAASDLLARVVEGGAEAVQQLPNPQPFSSENT